MTLISLFYTYISMGFLFPMYIITLVGKPLFLVKIIDKIIHFVEPIKHFEIFNLILGICGLGTVYNYWCKYSMESSIRRDLSLGHERLEDRVNLANSYERNGLIFVFSLAVLFSIYKFSQRYFRLDELKKELKTKKEKLDKIQPPKNADEKKKD